MSLVIECPGKTFLAGEYLALYGGPVLVFSSFPKFKLHVQNHFEDGYLKPSEIFNVESPAGRLVKKYTNFYEQFYVKFEDPYLLGGFGASTAQYVLLYVLLYWQESVLLDGEKYFDIKTLMQEYQEHAWGGVGFPPSGADLVSQVKGSLTWFDKSTGRITEYKWPFENLKLWLIHTGNKIATHDHLKDLKEFSPILFKEIMAEVMVSLENRDDDLFCAGVLKYLSELQKNHFVCKNTESLLNDVKTFSGVKAYKGCGALGSDVILLLTEKSEQVDQSINKWVEQNNNLKVIATEKQLSGGISLKVNAQFDIKKIPHTHGVNRFEV